MKGMKVVAWMLQSWVEDLHRIKNRKLEKKFPQGKKSSCQYRYEVG